MNLTVVSCLPSPQQWMDLRGQVGWATFDLETAQKSLNTTLHCVCAFDGDRLVGMGRVLGDGVISFYIGNVMVLPEHQQEGVGRAIMERLIHWVEQNAARGAIASLFAIKDKEEFYEKFGFVRRPDDKRGHGMSRYF